MANPPPLRLPPPSSVFTGLPRLDWTADLWRLQNGPGLLARRYPSPRFRFDAPHGTFAVTYLGSNPLAVFAEVFRDQLGFLEQDDADRWLVRATPRRPLVLLDFRDLTVRVALGLDERISVGTEYATCQAWSAAIHGAAQEFDGICYRSRLADATLANVVLFTERCQADLRVVALGRLRELEGTVLAAAVLYGLTIPFPFDRPEDSARRATTP